MSDKYDQGEQEFRCSFCGKPQSQVRRLIAGPGVYICDECVKMVSDIINDGVSFFIAKLIKHNPAVRDADGKLTKPESIELAHIELVQEELTVLAENADGIKKDLQRQMDEEAVRKHIDELKADVRIVYPHGTNFWERAK